MAAGRIRDEETFEEWYDEYNAIFGDFDTERMPLFMSGIQPLIMSGISNETLIVIEDFKAKIPASVPETEKRRRIDKYKSLLTQAFQEGNIVYEQLVVWGDSTFDDIPMFGDQNLVGVGSDGAEDSTDQIKAAGIDNWGDFHIDSVKYFYGPVVIPNDLTGDVTQAFDTTYQFPLLRDFINAHITIFANRDVGYWSKFFEVAFAGFVDTDVQTNEELVEDSAVSGSLQAIDNAIAGTGESVTLGEGKSLFELKQCALMSMLYDPTKNLKELSSASSKNTIDISNQKYNTYFLRNRIIPLYVPENEKIEHLNNYFYSDRNITKFFEQKNFSNKMRKELFYVYEDEEGQIKEIKLKKSSGLNDLNRSIDLINAEIEELAGATDANSIERRDNLIEEKAKIIFPDEIDYPDQTDFKYYRLDNVDIEYNGTNPSTARDDVKVTLKFYLESFAGLNAEMSTNIEVYANPDKKSILLRDLVISPIDDDGKSNLTSALRNTYHPDRNRIRIKVQPEEWHDNRTIGSETKYKQSPMILDLTTIDHEISRNDSTGEISFTITYRGYMQSLMQMPFADSLMTDKVVSRRKQRANNIKKIIDAGCSKETLRELLRVERNTTQNENTNNFGTIYSDLSKNKRIKFAKFKNKDFEFVLQDITSAGRSQFVQSIAIQQPTQPGIISTAHGLNFEDRLQGIATSGEDGGTGYSLSTLTKPIGIYDWWANDTDSTSFVFLGDLLLTVSKNLYKNDVDDQMIEELHNKLRFVFCPIDLPNPKDPRGYTRINPIEIPIDMFFFAEWFHEVIIKKDLRSYPIAAFVRDLIERLVNNLLYETCISNLLPDEQPPLLRSSYFSSTSDEDPSGGDLAKFYQARLLDPVGGPQSSFGYLENFDAPLFIRDSDLDSYVPQPVYQTDYIVIYCVSPPFKRELASQDEGQLRDEEYIPTLLNGTNTRSGVSMIHSLSFTKTNSPFLREARYFNNSFGSLALMNNVYDLNFKITDSAANSYLYPGMLINVIVTDFEKMGDIDYREPSTVSAEFVGPLLSSVVDDFGIRYTDTDCDPHFRNPVSDETTTAHILGIGGYFIIKSVTYNLGNSDRKYSIDVSCKFLGTEADRTVKRTKDITVIISEDKAECVEAYNEAVKINQAAILEFNNNKSDEQEERSSDFVTVGAPPPQNTNNENGTQQVTGSS